MMGMEPLNSVMSYQVQPMHKNQNDKAVVSEKSEDIVSQEALVIPDKSLAKIDKTAENNRDNENKDDGQEARAEQNQQKHNERMKKAVEQMNEKLQNSEAIFGIHEKTNRITIKIVDKETKEIIKELPPEKTLDMIAKVWEMAGILVDEKR